MNGLLKGVLGALCTTPFLLTGTTFVLEASRDLGGDIRARGLAAFYAAAESLPPLETDYIAASINPCLNAPGSFVKGTEHDGFFKAEIVYWRPLSVLERERLAQRLMQRCLKGYVLSAHDHEELYRRQRQLDATAFALVELRATGPASHTQEDMIAAPVNTARDQILRFDSSPYAPTAQPWTPFNRLPAPELR